MLTSVLIFSAEEYKPVNSWVFSDGTDPEPLNRLLLQRALRRLLGLTQGLVQRHLVRYLHRSHDDKDTFDDHRQGRVGLIQTC